jgi:AcrR family transcriptional regulator
LSSAIKDDAMPDMRPRDFRDDLREPPGRILDGMARAVSERGYGDTAVADVLTECHVSRRTFYQHFTGKEQCFLAAYDFAVEHVAAGVAQAYLSGAPNWRTQVHRAFQTFIGFVVAEPYFARLCLVEVLAAGPRALERRTVAVRRFTHFLEATARAAPTAEVAPAILPEAIVGGVQSVVSSRLLNERAGELTKLTGDLMFWGLVPFIGHDEAQQEQYTGVS